MKRKYIYYILCLVGVVSFSVGCKKQAIDENTDYIYYINNDEDKIVKEPYSLKATDAEEQVLEYIEQLKSVPKSKSYKNVLPSNMKLSKNDIGINVNGQLSIYFPKDYYELTGIKEILCRAAIVKTICQIEKVKFVNFYIDGNPLMVSDKIAVGNMYPEDFLDYSQDGKKYCQQVSLKLYFADERGHQLVAENISLEYDGNISLEELVIEELIKGPTDGTLQSTIPQDTTLLKISEQDGVCYVDFSENFLGRIEGINDDVVIYSVVNSLTEIANINKVQITVDGKYIKKYGNSILLDKPLEKNLNIEKEM